MKTGIKIYVAEVVYSDLGEDGKKHLKSMVNGYPSLELAKLMIDGFEESETRKLKFGKVFELEQYAEAIA